MFVGLTGVVFFSCVTKFSSTWFSDGERATSTGLAFVMANLGNFETYSNQVSILSGPSMKHAKYGNTGCGVFKQGVQN